MRIEIDGELYIKAPPVMAGDKTHEAALAVRFDADCGDNITVRDYFRLLLVTLWSEGESFSGKRPFGNSGWEYDLYVPLWKAGFIAGNPVEDEGMDLTAEQREDAESYVFDLINAALAG